MSQIVKVYPEIDTELASDAIGPLGAEAIARTGFASGGTHRGLVSFLKPTLTTSLMRVIYRRTCVGGATTGVNATCYRSLYDGNAHPVVGELLADWLTSNGIDNWDGSAGHGTANDDYTLTNAKAYTIPTGVGFVDINVTDMYVNSAGLSRLVLFDRINVEASDRIWAWATKEDPDQNVWPVLMFEVADAAVPLTPQEMAERNALALRMRTFGKLGAYYVGGEGAGIPIKYIGGLRSQDEHSSQAGRVGSILSGVEISNDPASPYGGVIEPSLTDRMTIGDVSYAVRKPHSLPASWLLELLSEPPTEFSRQNFRDRY